MGDSRRFKREDYSVGWVCALPRELTASMAMLDGRHDKLATPNDNNNYTLGRICGHNVVMACLPAGRLGLESAAVVASNMRASFPNIRFGLMVGIGGGVPRDGYDIRLGDVVVSQPSRANGGVIQYDFGRTVSGGQFIQTDTLDSPPNILLTALATLQAEHPLRGGNRISEYLAAMLQNYPLLAPTSVYPGIENDRLFQADYDHVENRATCDHCDTGRVVQRPDRQDAASVVHYGTIASGNQVMKHGATRDRISQSFPGGVLCYEMEAAGLMNDFRCIVVRGVCDYADSHKNDIWQDYASFTAAAYSKELLSVIAPRDVEAMDENLRLTDAERKIIESLPGHDLGNFLDFQEQPRENSCDWIPTNECFITFLSSSQTHVFHLVGEPGSGKSTAAAWLFRTSRSWTPGMQPLLFSFHGKPRASVAWSSLLFQLLSLEGTLVDVIHDALEDEDRRSRWKSEHFTSNPWTFSRLRDVFISVVKRLPETYRVLFIVDALDECDETVSAFLQSIADVLPDNPSARVKFILLSRDSSSSSTDLLFQPVGGTVRIVMDENRSHIENVQRYIQSKVDDLCTLRPGLAQLRQEIVKELQERSVGIYLLASLNLKSLATAMATPANIRSVIRTLPGDLSAIYSQALDEIAPANQRRAAALLLWVAFAMRPLRQWELSTAVTMTCLDDPVTENHNLMDQVSLDILGETGIRELVGPLVRVTGGGVVSLVHSSARQYLLDIVPTCSRLDWVWGSGYNGSGFDSVADKASQLLSMNCRDLIRFALTANITALAPESSAINNAETGIRSLVHYAIENLPEHVRQAPPGQDTHAMFASFLQSDNGKAWMPRFWMQRDPTQPYREFSPLEFCCALGLVETIKQLLPVDQYPRVKLPDVPAVKRAKTDATALLTAADLAAMFGNVEILRVLCGNMGTPADSDNLIPQTSWKAVPGGRWIHLGREYPYDIPDPVPGTRGEDVATEREKALAQLSWYRPLHTATAYGHAKAAEYLISQGGSISREDESGKWPIEIAMENKIEGLVHLLLAHHQQNLFRLARHLVESKNLKNIEKLVQLQPRLLSDGLHFRTIFGEHDGSMAHVAAAVGSLSAYEQLVRIGGDAGEHSLEDSEGRRAIHYAAASGQVEFIKSILADNLAFAADEDVSGRNSLFYAILGASCCADHCWTPATNRELVIKMLVEMSKPTDSQSLVISALASLANASFHVPSIRGAAKDNPETMFETSLGTLISITPNIALQGEFLHSAFRSTFFPLDVALDLATSVNDTDSRGRTALHIAATSERKWTMWHAKLAKMVANVNHRDVEGATALRLAIDTVGHSDFHAYMYPNLDKVEVLLDCGADPTCADDHGITPITAPAELTLTASDYETFTSKPSRVDGLLSLLLSQCSNAAESISGEVLVRLVTALAITRRQQDLTSLMKEFSTTQKAFWLEKGLDMGYITAEVLFSCHELGWPSEALSTITQHLDTKHVEIAYDRAFIEKRRVIVEMCQLRLENHNIAVWLDRRNFRRHVINAAQRGDKETIEIFLEVMGGSVNETDGPGQTILSHAAETGHCELTKYLLSRGADSSIPDAKGQTAVYWSAREGKLDALKLLTEAGAAVTDEDIDIARSMNRGAVQDYLEEQVKCKSSTPKRRRIESLAGIGEWS